MYNGGDVPGAPFQWLRDSELPMQGAWVPPLSQELDPTGPN